MIEQPARHLDRALLSGVAWTAFAKWTTQVLSWISTLFVARLLVPADYGILGSSVLILGFFTMLGDFGLGAAVVQKRAMRSEILSRLSGVSLGFGIVLAGLAIGLSWPASIFFAEPALRRTVVVMSATLVLSGLQVVPRALLSRDLQFRFLALVDSAEAIVAALTTLTLALLGAGYWALVLGNLAAKVVATILIMLYRFQKLSRPGPLSELREELQFGSHMFVANVGWYVYGGADIAIIGRVLGTGALGAYSLALNLATAPLVHVTNLISRVTPGVFSAVQGNRIALTRYLAALIEGQAFLVFPAGVGIALVAPDIVDLALGVQWRPAVIPLRILAICTAFRCLTPILVQALVYSGHPKQNSLITLRAALLLPILFIVGAHWGSGGVAAGWLIGFVGFILPMVLSSAKRHLGFNLADFVRSVSPALTCTIAMVISVLMSQRLLGSSDSAAVRLAESVFVGIAAYALAVLSLYWSRVTGFLQHLRALRA